MTDFQPTPQTPEQVDEGLRNAMKQAKKDGVFDWDRLSEMNIASVNMPVAILVWLMIFPMMVQIDFNSIKDVKKNPIKRAKTKFLILQTSNFKLPTLTLPIPNRFYLSYLYSKDLILINP